MDWKRISFDSLLPHCYAGFEKEIDCAKAKSHVSQKFTRMSKCACVPIGQRHVKLAFAEPKAKNTFHKYWRDHLQAFGALMRGPEEYSALWESGCNRATEFVKKRVRDKQSYSGEEIPKAMFGKRYTPTH